jgi:hypothetical protein
MCKKEKTVEKHFDNNIFIRNFTVIILSVLVILFVMQWRSLHKDFDSFKIDSQEQVTRLENSKTNLIQLEDVEQDSLNYIFKAADIEKINNNLNALASEIYQERNKAEAIIDKDIDRLNLYMAIGIGFLALLGIFVPFLVNVLSNDDLKKKQEALDDKLKRIVNQFKDLDKEGLKQAIINANQALEKSKEIDNLNTKTDNILPKLSIISLQIAIHRLFNVSSLALSKNRDESKKLFKELFENIKNRLVECQSDENLNISNSEIMKLTLVDFAELIDNESFKFTSYITTSRNINEKILIESLRNLSQSNGNNQEENFKLVIQSFDTFIEQIQNTDA